MILTALLAVVLLVATPLAIRRGAAIARWPLTVGWTWVLADLGLAALTPGDPGPPPTGKVSGFAWYADRRPIPEGLAASPAPDDPRPTMLVIGDSFTFGQNVARDRVFPSLIAQARPDILVRNHGNHGASFDSERWHYALVDRALDADLVLWVVFLNDFGVRCASPPCGELVSAERVPDPVGSPVVDRIRTLVAHRRITADTISGYRANLGPDGPAVRSLREDLPPLVDSVTGRGGRFVLAIFPVLYDLTDYPFAAEHQRLAALGADAGAEVVDLLPVFEGHDAASLWVDPSDHHPNATGHALAAEHLLRAIGPEPLPDSRPWDCAQGPHLLDPPYDALETALCEDASPAGLVAIAQGMRARPGFAHLVRSESIVEDVAAVAWVRADRAGDRQTRDEAEAVLRSQWASDAPAPTPGTPRPETP